MGTAFENAGRGHGACPPSTVWFKPRDATAELSNVVRAP